MDNNELENILKSRFTGLEQAPDGASQADEIMARIDAGADTQPPVAQHSANHDWVLGFAWLLGALVCIPSLHGLQGLDLQGMLSFLPMDVFGSYAQTAAALAMPLLGVCLLLPMAWLALDD